MVAASKPTSWLSGQSHILFHLVRTSGPWLAVWAVSLSTMDLITHSLTPKFLIYGIRSLRRFGNLVGPLAYSVLYPRKSSLEASPKAISGRTSYLRVRLAFHPYPHLIRRLFNVGRFGPPPSLTLASPWTWVDHAVSGLQQRTFSALFRLGFPPAAHLKCLTSLVTVTRRLILQKARRHASNSAPTACRHTVSGSVSLPSRGAFHLSLTVLVHYRSPGSI